MSARAHVLGVPVDALTRSEALQHCASALRGSALRQIITANPEFVLHARRDPAVRGVAAAADLVVADGVGVLWAARRAGTPLPERIPGVELVEDLCRTAARERATVFLFGGRREGVVERAAAALRRAAPELQITAFAHAHRADDPPEALWEELARVRPAALAVAYGQPAQELWIARHRDRLAAAGVRIAIGVGGALDMLAGDLPRAPRFVRAAGCEWLWRLVLEPKRLPRVFHAAFVFPLMVLLSRRNAVFFLL